MAWLPMICYYALANLIVDLAEYNLSAVKHLLDI